MVVVLVLVLGLFWFSGLLVLWSSSFLLGIVDCIACMVIMSYCEFVRQRWSIAKFLLLGGCLD